MNNSPWLNYIFCYSYCLRSFSTNTLRCLNTTTLKTIVVWRFQEASAGSDAAEQCDGEGGRRVDGSGRVSDEE